MDAAVLASTYRVVGDRAGGVGEQEMELGYLCGKCINFVGMVYVD